jgi:aspartyl-tRNA(Asn)/glutamyl-tRNA(Gln) amidotransferase subunit B
MLLEPVIGLEIHLQLKTATKMFCACKAHEEAQASNMHVCPVCMGHPGALPVPNETAVRDGILMAMALGCCVSAHTKFDRKQYFYPDLPKAYQISQFDLPLAREGMLEIEIPGTHVLRSSMTVGITRVHLEEDAGKLFHGKDGRSYVDFNRGGVPLIEIVTEPDFRTPQEAKAFLQELRAIARALGISDADMEKGHLRCDANISLRPVDECGDVVGPRFHPKTEVKNINSFRFVERALTFEIERQTKLWEAGNPPNEETTRGWNETTQTTEEQRSKEATNDYRYFPEPDIPPLDLTALTEEMRSKFPELPAKRRARFVEEYGLKKEDARALCEDVDWANYAEAVFSELASWLQDAQDHSEEQALEERRKLASMTANWMLNRLKGLMTEQTVDIKRLRIRPEDFAEFITMLALRKINQTTGTKLLSAMIETGDDPSHLLEEKKLGSMADAEVLADAVERVLQSHPQEVERYRQGKKELLAFFIGLVMKETEGTADAAALRNLLLVKLET